MSTDPLSFFLYIYRERKKEGKNNVKYFLSNNGHKIPIIKCNLWQHPCWPVIVKYYLFNDDNIITIVKCNLWWWLRTIIKSTLSITPKITTVPRTIVKNWLWSSLNLFPALVAMFVNWFRSVLNKKKSSDLKIRKGSSLIRFGWFFSKNLIQSNTIQYGLVWMIQFFVSIVI